MALALSSAPAVSYAQGSGKITLIRDAEIENTIRIFARPVLEAAGLDPAAFTVHLVLDDRINAFVAGGQRLFINSGLLRNAKSANAIIGVLAHETGHIAGGHLAQMQQNLRNASAQSIIALVLGAVAAGASGNPEALIAGASVGQSAATGSYLHYSRGMESQADQAALHYLDETKQSARGLLDILNQLQSQELLTAGRQDPYLRTHPLSQDRIATVRAYVDKSKYSDVPPNPLYVYLEDRMRGKLNGYIDPPEVTLNRYKGRDDVEARYARVFALEKLNRIDEAVSIIDGLIKEKPEDPFFEETKGYVLWKAGRVKESIEPYRRSVELSDGRLPLLRIGLGQALLELKGHDAAKEAADQLSKAVQYEQRTPKTWRLLATAYGRMNEFGAAAYALAEEAILLGDRDGAARNVKKALESLPAGSPMHSRALDIQHLLEGMKKPE